MSVTPEISAGIQICPFWRKVAVVENRVGQVRVIGMCGVVKRTEELPNMRDLGNKLPRCPFDFGIKEALTRPSIILTSLDMKDYKILGGFDLRGERGIGH